MEGELVLVTGASGYIGSWVCKKLQEEGYRVRGTVRSLQNKTKVDFLYNLCSNPKYPIELVEADLLKPDSWPEAVKGCKYVMHTASPFVFQNPRNPDDLLKPAREGTLNVLRAVADAGTVEKVVITSSFAAAEMCGRQTGTYTEEDWSVPENQKTVYAQSKTLAEKAAWDFVKDLPDRKFTLTTVLPVAVVGPFLSCNPGESFNIMSQIMDGKIAMIPQFSFPFVDVRDVASAHVKCITSSDVAEKRVLASTETLFYPDAVKIIADEMNPQGYKIPTRVMPNPLMKVASWFSGELRGLRSLGEVPKIVDNERIKSLLGTELIPTKKTLIDAVYSLIELGRIKKTEQYKGRSTESTQSAES